MGSPWPYCCDLAAVTTLSGRTPDHTPECIMRRVKKPVCLRCGGPVEPDRTTCELCRGHRHDTEDGL